MVSLLIGFTESARFRSALAVALIILACIIKDPVGFLILFTFAVLSTYLAIGTLVKEVKSKDWTHDV